MRWVICAYLNDHALQYRMQCIELNRTCSECLCGKRIAISISVRKYSLVKVRRLKYSVQKEGLIYVSSEGRTEGPSLIAGNMAEGDVDCHLRFLAITGPTCHHRLALVYSVIKLFCLWIRFTFYFRCILVTGLSLLFLTGAIVGADQYNEVWK